MSVAIIEAWDGRGKKWVPVAFDWYTDEEGERELNEVRRANPGEKFRLMTYIQRRWRISRRARRRSFGLSDEHEQ